MSHYTPLIGTIVAGLEPLFVIETNIKMVEQLRGRGVEVQTGNAAAPELLRAANIAGARFLFLAIPNAFECGQIVKHARAANPGVKIVARSSGRGGRLSQGPQRRRHHHGRAQDRPRDARLGL